MRNLYDRVAPALAALEDGTWRSASAAEGHELVELERAGDAAFRQGDLRHAERIFRALESRPEHRLRMMLKRSDVAFVRGRLDEERRLRESIYGRLVAEDR